MAVGIDGEVGLAPAFDAVGFFAIFNGPVVGGFGGLSFWGCGGQIAQAVGEFALGSFRLAGGSVELVDHGQFLGFSERRQTAGRRGFSGGPGRFCGVRRTNV